MLTIDPFDLLEADVSSLKASMDSVMSGGTEDFAKWVAFQAFAREFNRLSEEFSKVFRTETFPHFQTDTMKSANDTLWPDQKQIFEMVYIEVSKLHARMSRLKKSTPDLGFSDLLHADILKSSASHFKNEDYRNAVLDGVVTLFDMIRKLAKIDLDGHDLCNNAFSVKSPKIVLSEVGSQSGRNDQLGFLELTKGLYSGVRNPNAHTLANTLDAEAAAQYLVFISLLLKRLENATIASD